MNEVATVLDLVTITQTDGILVIFAKVLFLIFMLWMAVRLMDSYRESVRLKIEMIVGYWKVGWYRKSAWNVFTTLLIWIYETALIYAVLLLLEVFVGGVEKGNTFSEYRLIISFVSASILVVNEVRVFFTKREEVDNV